MTISLRLKYFTQQRHQGASKNIMHRIRLKKILLALIALLTVCVLFECVFRFSGLAPNMPKAYQDNVYISDPHLPYRPAPNISRNVLSGSGEFNEIFTHNSAGFRDVEHSVDKTSGAFRILALGDSFTYGAGAPFERTWLVILENQLNNRPGRHPPVEIIKAGVGGFFPEAERLLLEHIGLAYSPDLLLVGFNPSDLFETYQGLDEVRMHDGFLKTAAARRMGKTGTFLYLHSCAARALLNMAQKTNHRRKMREFEANRDVAWLKLEAEYERMFSMLPNGARMAIVLIPFAAPPSPRSDAARLEAFCKQRGIVFIDATPALCSELSREAPLFWPRDGHCTPRGYAVLAEFVFNAFAENDIVP